MYFKWDAFKTIFSIKSETVLEFNFYGTLHHILSKQNIIKLVKKRQKDCNNNIIITNSNKKP